MLSRSLSLAASAAVLVTLAAGAVALADTPAPATGPGTAACEEATAAVTLAATAAAKAAGDLADAQAQLGDANKAVQDRLAALVAANNALKGASDDLTADELATLKAAASKAGTEFAGAVQNLLNLGANGVSDLVKALDAARAKLATAVDARTAACAAPAAPPADPKRCSDFPSRAAAQAVLEQDPTDPLHLDPDGDGRACFITPTARHTQVTTVPAGSVATGG